MKPSHDIILITISILSVFLLFPAHVILLQPDQEGLSRAPLNASFQLLTDSNQADFDSDGQDEQVTLVAQTVTIQQENRILWQSPPEWNVLQFHITDLNHDQIPEITLLVWRAFSPWPIDSYLKVPGRIDEFHDSRNRSCHLILIGWKNSSFAELWAGSALSQPVTAFQAIDLNNDSQQELITLDGRYDHSHHQTQTISTWTWSGFGFSLHSRISVQLNESAIVFEQNQLPGIIVQGRMEGE